MTNWLAAVLRIVRADSDVQELAADRCFGLKLPREEAENMPGPCVVLRPAGGSSDTGLVNSGTHRIDVFAYGLDESEAWDLSNALHGVLKGAARQLLGDTVVFSCTRESGQVFMLDPDGDWPVVLETWLVQASEMVEAA
jgi:hypothetical protein